MSKIFIVTTIATDYDSVNKSFVGFKDESKAIDLVEKLSKLSEFNQQFKTRTANEFGEPWKNNNPAPDPPVRPLPSEEFRAYEIMLANSKGQVPDDVKAKFRKLQQEHYQNIDAYKALEETYSRQSSERYAKFMEARKQWMEFNYNPDSSIKDAHKYIGYDGCYDGYNYYELELEE